MNKMKTFFGAAVLAVTVAFGAPHLLSDPRGLYGVRTAEAAETSPDFAWHPNRPGIKRAQVALGRASTLKFEFSLKAKPGVTQVKFGIPKKFATMGVKIDPSGVSVTDGLAASKAVLRVPPGMPLGKFDIPVVMIDAKTGQELGRGEIPIMLLPAGVGGC
ncbi:MAG: hypothetical protein ACYC69_08940 [Thermodesulfovibrionales bacterium]